MTTQSPNQYHTPVLLHEAIEYLHVVPNGRYVDATLGGGGHTQKIIEFGGTVLAIDQDQDALDYVQQTQAEAIKNKKLTLYKGNFAHLKEIATANEFLPVNGVLFDLGVSSHQLETSNRGFSFNVDAPLDMRKDQVNQTVTAADLISAGGETELAHLFWRFGEERDSKRIAKAIVEHRKVQPILSTNDLAQIITKASHKSFGDRTHPATRVFQALRIAVNDELATFEQALPQAVDILDTSGRLVVISFHSLEDRIIKDFIQNCPSLENLTKKIIRPSDEEISSNSRSRSGKLRAALKI